MQNAVRRRFHLHEQARVHEVLWLALMGLGDYRGAAIEAHAVDHFGVTPRWNDVAMKHEDQTRFAEQMKKLEQFVDRRNQDLTSPPSCWATTTWSWAAKQKPVSGSRRRKRWTQKMFSAQDSSPA